MSATALTPPASSLGLEPSWSVSAAAEEELSQKASQERDAYVASGGRLPLAPYNGNFTSRAAPSNLDDLPRKYINREMGNDARERNAENDDEPASYGKGDRGRSSEGTFNAPESQSTIKTDRIDEFLRRTGDMSPDESSGTDDNSKWIHRDKLAKIENEELQAAGIILPKIRDWELARSRSKSRSRAQSRSRRDRDRERESSQDATSGRFKAVGADMPRSRKNSEAGRGTDGSALPAWDLRLPEEIAMPESDSQWSSTTRTSRIPVAKASPAPVPTEHLERATLVARKRDASPNDESIAYPRPRTRSASTVTTLKSSSNGPTLAALAGKRVENSPKKTAPGLGTRKPSIPRPANGSVRRPRTRGGSGKDSANGSGVISFRARSGELSPSPGNSKQMEGEPPWMVSAYRPDPRLPPDQQLLPTVARRLQQEKWEKEGKFGYVYDKEFRPLSDEGFLKPPGVGDTSPTSADQGVGEGGDGSNSGGNWPLKSPDQPRTSGSPTRRGSYSTMPKISDKPTLNSLPGSRLPSPRTSQGQMQSPIEPIPAVPAVSAVPAMPALPDNADPPRHANEKENKKKNKAGCRCCVVM